MRTRTPLLGLPVTIRSEGRFVGVSSLRSSISSSTRAHKTVGTLNRARGGVLFV